MAELDQLETMFRQIVRDELMNALVARMDAQQISPRDERGRAPAVRDKRGFTVAEAALYLGISEWVLRCEVRENRLAARKRGTTLLFDRAELDRYFDSLPER
ncbi:helix-turn-helix domain-containing protein [Microbacterium bovistercoris]|nr:helix-turn-helix domain-containing protein [Microbacterium bovistercoris]